MPVGYRNSTGVDFDSLFDPYIQGAKPANCGFRDSSGTDLVERYAPISFGTKGPDVGFRTPAGLDVSNLWASIGTAVYTLPFNGKNYDASAQALSGQSGTIGSSVSLSINSNGTWSIGGGPNFSGSPVSGTWLPAGASVAEYEVQFVVSGTGGSNDAPNYVSCSATRACSVSAQVEASSTNFVANGASITCRLRRIATGAVTTTACNFSASALGQV